MKPSVLSVFHGCGRKNVSEYMHSASDLSHTHAHISVMVHKKEDNIDYCILTSSQSLGQ